MEKPQPDYSGRGFITTIIYYLLFTEVVLSLI